MRWADAKRTAAVSACFIWVNSAAGLYGHIARHHFDVSGLGPLIFAAFLGGAIGANFGARRFGEMTLRRALAGVLAVAAYKMFKVAMMS